VKINIYYCCKIIVKTLQILDNVCNSFNCGVPVGGIEQCEPDPAVCGGRGPGADGAGGGRQQVHRRDGPV